MDARDLSRLYRKAHNLMRDAEGLLPQEAFDELLKFLVFKTSVEQREQLDRCNAASLVDDPKTIRHQFMAELDARIPWAKQVWRDGEINLSDRTLLEIQDLFSDVTLSGLSLDARSVALRTFLRSGLRKGLGVFLTPEAVVRAMVEISAPRVSDVILDPACGSGTFLIEAARFLTSRATARHLSPLVVRGIDKSPRMLLLSYLNFCHRPEVVFRGACADTLRDIATTDSPILGLRPDSVDLILTNPPFGVSVTKTENTPSYLLNEDRKWRSQTGARFPSEILFVTRCLHLLKPGGRLAIVLPRSVITNESLLRQRRAIDQLGQLTTLIDLPAETFSATGAQTTTVVAFFRKNNTRSRRARVSVHVCHVTNVGFDSTGRARKGSQLPELAAELRQAGGKHLAHVQKFSDIPSSETLQRAAHLLFRRNGGTTGPPLRDFVLDANTGRTPSRNAYTDEGVFILKVGNLTGHGIDWKPRERNFVSCDEGVRRQRTDRLSVRAGDILLTSSAHAPRYIAKKVDIVSMLPQYYDSATFVGELIRVRPATDVDPYVLLAALRQRGVREELQACVRGQTAHLHPRDLLAVSVPWELRSPSRKIREIAELLKREAHLAFRLNTVSQEAARLLELSVPTAV